MPLVSNSELNNSSLTSLGFISPEEDFNEFEFLKAIIDYQSRNRRLGGIESLPNESFEDSQYSS